MSKRLLDTTHEDVRSRKRFRNSADRFSTISDELLLRILSYLPVETLALCQSVSQRLRNLAGDPSLWRRAYFDSFIQPRITRLIRKRRKDHNAGYSGTPASIVRWLDEDNVGRSDRNADWKQRYKTRSRWTSGLCELKEIAIGGSPPLPTVVARMLDSIVYTADSQHGLRAWSYKTERRVLATCCFAKGDKSRPLKKPTSIAVDRLSHDRDLHRLAIGFDDGSLTTHTFQLDTHDFGPGSSPSQQALRQSSAITSISLSWPYLLTMNQSRILILYHLGRPIDTAQTSDGRARDTLLSALKSDTISGPLTISIRRINGFVLACLAYTYPTLGSGWSAGMQELKFDESGNLVESRLASTVVTTRPSQPNATCGVRHAPKAAPQPSPVLLPTSISYTHPYLLMAHADNTLTLYLVVSLTASLTISSGTRLWGHTSSVFEAHVGCRGKAVSISSRGDEVRVWQLEEAAAGRDHAGSSDIGPSSSVQLVPEKPRPSTPARVAVLSKTLADRGSRFGLASPAEMQDPGWVGFDDENVVLLKSKRSGTERLLAVYDFT